jgi:DMSO/TMAO reductase YedYZ molybdopterin-dependent catalytic subunit
MFYVPGAPFTDAPFFRPAMMQAAFLISAFVLKTILVMMKEKGAAFMKYKWMLLPVLLFLLSGCAAKTNTQPRSAADGVSSSTQRRYRENEVAEYQGIRLDPAVGPRDNSIKGIQKVDVNGYTLTVDGLVNAPATFSYDEVKALPVSERLITLHCVEGWDATILWKGALLNDLMDKAGIKPEAVTVIFGSVDGYTTSLPLKTVQDKQLILAYGANGLDLPPQMGYPFIVVAEDKLGYKWARWVNRITLSSDPNYKGYWEQNGYSNNADVKE